MTVLKTFQCNICHRPCVGEGAITLILERKEGTILYEITPGLKDVETPEGRALRHICRECACSIMGVPEGADLPRTPEGGQIDG